MTLPRVQPIAPTWRKDPFDHPEWVFDVKYDGFRAVAYIEQRRTRLISRNNNIMTRFDVLAKHPEAAAWLSLGEEVDIVLGDTLYVVR